MHSAEVFCALEKQKIEYASMFPLNKCSTFRIGGKAELAVMPDSADALVACLRIFRELDIEFEMIGNASNILFGDGVIQKALIFTKKISDITVKENVITASCGATLANLANLAAEHSLSGLEFARGIPGTVGGAVFMNAGAYGGSMSDIVVKSQAVDIKNGEIIEIVDHCFDYRKSIYSQNKDIVCLSAEFLLKKGDKTEIYEKMCSLTAQRKEKQPIEYPSAGSYFKRPEGYFAAKLIDDCGLKGYRIGGAAVSEKHAGFVINLGDATARDVLLLEQYVRKSVFERFGVELEREVRLIM